jgi:glycosyltransferase involved in cell wall biosynthesis
VRILLVSQMYPGPDDPHLGVFVRQLEQQLRELGHDVDPVVLEGRGGGRRRHLTLAWRARARARENRPDVVYGHFLFPAGMAAALAARHAAVPLVVTAHGRDVRNVGALPGVGWATGWVLKRAAATIAVSEFLRRELETKLPDEAGEIEVIDCGVDLSRFDLEDPAAARRAVGWDATGPRYLHVGTLDERKNVVRLAEAFASLGEGSLAFVGDGPLRAELEGRPGVTVVGRVPHEEVSSWVAAADVVCQPSLVEPFGLAILEAMAAGRTVVATRIGGPADFVPADAGILVDPLRVEEIASAMLAARAFPTPNRRAREAARGHDVGVQAGRIAGVLERAIASGG